MVRRSARNRFVGLVTSVLTDTVMTQVEIRCGPHRVVSLMWSEAVPEPGVRAVSVIKSNERRRETPGGTS